MSFVCINQHDWSAVEDWFERRAKEAGVSKYQYSETVRVPHTEKELLCLSAARSYGIRMAEEIDRLFLSAK